MAVGLKCRFRPNSITAFVSASADSPVPPPSPRGGLFESVLGRPDGLGVIVFGLLLYVPLAGTYGLLDPWETHYGEVARQMTVRNDYISLWWPGAPLDPDHFWSKPVLSFWLMSLFMHLFGVAGGAPGRNSARAAAPNGRCGCRSA